MKVLPSERNVHIESTHGGKCILSIFEVSWHFCLFCQICPQNGQNSPTKYIADTLQSKSEYMCTTCEGREFYQICSDFRACTMPTKAIERAQKNLRYTAWHCPGRLVMRQGHYGRRCSSASCALWQRIRWRRRTLDILVWHPFPKRRSWSLLLSSVKKTYLLLRIQRKEESVIIVLPLNCRTAHL